MKLKIKHKFFLLVGALMIVMSLSILLSAIALFKSGSRRVMEDISGNLEQIRDASVSEFNRFTELADQGIREASGQMAVDAIVKIARDNQAAYVNMANEAIAGVSDRVAGNTEQQNDLINRGLDTLLAISTNHINDIMLFDRRSQDLLGNMSLFNIHALESSIADSISRLDEIIINSKKGLDKQQDLSNQAIDAALIQIITQLDTGKKATPEALTAQIISDFELLKSDNEKQNTVYFQELNDAFQLETKAILEELNIVSEKVAFAIRSELQHAETMQTEKVETNKSVAIAKFQEITAKAKTRVAEELTGVTLRTSSYGFGLTLVCVFIGVILALFFVSRLLQPLTRTVDILKDIAESEGDLTRRLEVHTGDEMAELAHWFNTFIEKIQSIITVLVNEVDNLSTSSGDLA